jgi:hypothetical protein
MISGRAVVLFRIRHHSLFQGETTINLGGKPLYRSVL